MNICKINGTPFIMYFIEIHNKRKITLIVLFSWNWIISYNQKCFKHFFLELILTELQLLITISRKYVKTTEKYVEFQWKK